MARQLDLQEIQTFLIHENFFVIVFQRYVVAGLDDYPTTIKVPYNILKGHTNLNNPLISLLENTVSAKSFISSWENVWGQESIETTTSEQSFQQDPSKNDI